MRSAFGIFLLIFLHSALACEPPVIVLLGKPGAGKGTYAVKLKENFHIPHISTGELIKENIRQGTPLGKIAQSHVENGTFPPDDLIANMLFEHYQNHDYSRGCILDGFPRTIYQAQLLEEKLGSIAKILVIYLAVSDALATERILGRLMCGHCYATYNTLSAPPKRPGVCDFCQEDLYRRQDDCLEVIKTRLSVFQEKTAPVVQYYQNQNNLFEIDSDQSIEKIYDAILHALDLPLAS